jgi:hypothetical protein
MTSLIVSKSRLLIANGVQLPFNHSPTNHCSCERRSYRDG